MKDRFLFFGLVLLFLALTVWLASVPPEGVFGDLISRYGYVGFLFASFFGGLNLAVPSLHLAFVVPLLNAGLSIWVLVLLAGVGTTLADSVGYALGRTGEKSFGRLRRLRGWGERFVSKYSALLPVIIVGWAAFIPLPNEAFVIPAGLIRYGFVRTISLTFLGNLVFNLLALNFGNLFV